MSDAFAGDDPAVEVVATVINVNEGGSPELAVACRALAGHSFLVARVREGSDAGLPLREAILRAIDESVGMGYLVNYLTERRAEAADMFMTEWDEGAYVENERRDSYAEGLEIAREAREGLRPIFGDNLTGVVMYGSCARGDADGESDVDIAALVDMPRSQIKGRRAEVVSLMSRLTLEHGRLASITEIPLSDYRAYGQALPFYRNVAREGVAVGA